MQRENKTLLNNIASLGIVQIVNYIFPLLTVPYVSRIIGPEGYGIVNYSTAFIGYFVLLVSFGFDFTATRRISARASDIKFINKVFKDVLNARLLIFLLCIPLFLICTFFIPMLKNNLVISLILFLNVASTLLTPQYVFQGMQRLALFSRLNLFRGIINTCLIFLFVSEKDDIIIYAGIGVSTNLAIAIFWNFYLWNYLKLKFTFKPLKNSIYFLWRDRFMFFSSVVFSLYTTTNVVILGFFANATNIGYYTTAITFITIIQNVINIPLSSSLYPFIGKAFSSSTVDGVEKLRRILPVIFYICLVMGFGILLFSPFAITLLFGKKFYGSIIVVQILSFLPLISGMSGLMGVQTMLNLKMDKTFLKITSMGALLSIILNLVLVNYWGYIGTTVSYLLTEIFIVISLFISLKSKGISLFFFDNFRPVNIMSLLKTFKRV